MWEQMIEHKCFRCGDQSFQEDTGTILRCEGCGEKAVVSFQLAVDLLNEVFLQGLLHLEEYQAEDFD